MSLADLARALWAERFTPVPEHHEPQDTEQACASRRARLLAAIRNNDEGEDHR